MRLVTTAVLGVVAIVLAVAIARLNRESSSGRGSAVEASVLTRFDSGLVDRITLKKTDKEVVIERAGRLWFFTEPENDRADAVAVNTLLDQLNHLNTCLLYTSPSPRDSV